MSVNTKGIRTTTHTHAVVQLLDAVAMVKTMDNKIAELKKQIAIAEAAVKAASLANLNYVKQNAENMVATAKADAARASASLVLELSAMNTSHLKTMDELAANNANSENKLSEALAIDAPENDADAVKRADAALAELAKAKDAEKAQDDADAAAQAVYAAAAAAAAAQAKDAAAAAAAAQAKAAAEAKDAAAKTAAAAAAAQAKAADDAKDAAAKTAAAQAAATAAAAAAQAKAAAQAAAAAAVAAEKDKLINGINGLKAKLSDVQFVNTFLAPIELEYINDTANNGKLTIKEKEKIIAEIALYPAAKAAADKAAADKAAADKAAAAAAAAAKVEAEKKAAAEAAAAAAAAKAKAEAEAKAKAEAAAKAAAKAAADKAVFDKLDLNANGELTQMEFDGTQDKIDWYRAVDTMDLSISSYELFSNPKSWKLPAGRAEYTLLTFIYVDQSLIEAISGNSFSEWKTKGKLIPKDMVVLGGSLYYDEATGKQRSDIEVYDLIFSKIVLYGFIAEDKNGDVFVSFRGTEGFYEWVEDFKVYAQSCSFLKTNANAVDAKVHRGFNDIYDGCYVDKVKGESVRTYLFGLLGKKTNNILYLTGHSLGAAVAALGACDMVVNAANVFKKVIVYNYASPKLSNKAFNTFFSKQVPNAFWRMYNENDLVPQLPLPSLLPGNAGNDYESLEVGYQVNFGNELPSKNPLGAYVKAVIANHSALAYQKAVYAAYDKARDEGNNGLLGAGDTTNVDLKNVDLKNGMRRE